MYLIFFFCRHIKWRNIPINLILFFLLRINLQLDLCSSSTPPEFPNTRWSILQFSRFLRSSSASKNWDFDSKAREAAGTSWYVRLGSRQCCNVPKEVSLLNLALIFFYYLSFFSSRFYWVLYFFLHVLLPINAPLEYWGDTIPAAIFVTFSLRYLIVLNVCWLINSAHFVWGLNKNFKPSDSNMIFIITKSYWPQYHYLLPRDYQTGEFGDYGKKIR